MNMLINLHIDCIIGPNKAGGITQKENCLNQQKYQRSLIIANNRITRDTT